VLSTLHTNTAIGAITRLQDMGIEPFLLSSSLLAVMAQRLVRLLCNECKEPYEPDAAELKLLKLENETTPQLLFHARGCALCNRSGYRGRTGIYEFIEIDDRLRTMIHERASEQQMIAYARSCSPSIGQDGRRRILTGETTVEEVLRVTSG
jgi:general secretion pathway protein E